IAGSLTDLSGLVATGLAQPAGDGVIVTAVAPLATPVVHPGTDLTSTSRGRVAIEVSRDAGEARAGEPRAKGRLFPGPAPELVVAPLYVPGPPPVPVQARRPSLSAYAFALLPASAVPRSPCDP